MAAASDGKHAHWQSSKRGPGLHVDHASHSSCIMHKLGFDRQQSEAPKFHTRTDLHHSFQLRAHHLS
jgi:hypothetical protein